MRGKNDRQCKTNPPRIFTTLLVLAMVEWLVAIHLELVMTVKTMGCESNSQVKPAEAAAALWQFVQERWNHEE